MSPPDPRGRSHPDCLLWDGNVDKDGYGRHGWRLAHRYVWEQEHGKIPDGMTVDHVCRTRLCVNTDHMELMTQAENNARKTQTCGHAGRVAGRKCATCRREAGQLRGWVKR